MRNYALIPQELRILRQWVVWVKSIRDGRETKLPVNALTGRLASATDPATWCSFEEAVAASAKYEGIGFVFTPVDPYTGIDLDKSTDPAVWEAQNKIFRMTNSYAECSPSGNGCHIIVRAKLPGPGRRKHAIEMYDQVRYFTMTGDVIGGRVTIEEAQPLVDQLYLELGGSNNGTESNAVAGRGWSAEQIASDADICARIGESASGERFNRLFAGAWARGADSPAGEGYPSQSEADQAIINIIAKFTQNHEQIARIFHTSALGQREKAYRADYLRGLTRNGLDRHMPPASVEAARASAAPHIERLAQSGAHEQAAHRKSGRIDVAPLTTEEEELALIRGDTVDDEPIDWLWEGWLARGQFHLIGGAPDAGKTTIILSLAAIITRGDLWPGGKSRAPVGDVVIWSGEDEIKNTIGPRLRAMGADMTHIYYIGARKDKTGKVIPFDPSTDLELLAREVKRIPNPMFAMIDPVVAVIPARVDGNNGVGTRNALQPIRNLALETGIAVYGITHFSKGTSGRNPVERITGSVAFGALARVVTVATVNSSEDADPPRLFIRVKGNNSDPKTDGLGFGYDIQSALNGPRNIKTSRIVWGEELTGTAKELLNDAEKDPDDDAKKTKVDVARQWLFENLGALERPANDIFREAGVVSISKSSLDRASVDIVEKRKDGLGAWMWRLKASEKKKAQR